MHFFSPTVGRMLFICTVSVVGQYDQYIVSYCKWQSAIPDDTVDQMFHHSNIKPTASPIHNYLKLVHTFSLW